LRYAVVDAAEAAIAGKIGIVEAAHRLMELAAELDVLDDDDFAFFIELDAQSDGFPVGVARKRWSAAALEREDFARRTFEASIRDDASAHCRSLISKYATAR
jgi:hypothetical protein